MKKEENMAGRAMADQEKRVVEVNREDLIRTLKANRKQHIDNYNEAISGYKEMALAQVELAKKEAELALIENISQAKTSIERFDPENPENPEDTSDYLQVVDNITLHLEVPKNYTKEYDAAIDIATWDVNDTMKLSYAEFTCFVRDQWDWTSNFNKMSATYSNKI